MVNYVDLGLKNASSPKTIKIGDTEVKVLQYLPSADKYDLVDITVQKAIEDGVVNPFKLDMYFHLHLVMMYTDIIFSPEDRIDDFALYDALMTNDVINLVVNAMDEDEYTSLFTMVEELSNSVAEYKQSVAGLVNNLMTMLPEQAEKLQEAVEHIDADKVIKMTEVIKDKD